MKEFFLKLTPVYCKKVLIVFSLLFVLQENISAQTVRLVTGTVTLEGSKNNEGVTISVKNKQTAAITNAEGKYGIRVSNSDTLIFTSIGYQTIAVPVLDKEVIDVTLSNKVSSLDEVVVIGYGTVKKADFTGAASQIDMNQLMKTPVASYTDGLAGRAAGVKVSTQDGQPGVESDIVIRGASSLTQSNSPLYVIDGFPVESIQQAAINPEDIESISILKDASSTAIYGTRATNGVVIITTKKGKVGKPVVTLSSSLGFQKVTKRIEVMSPYEYLKFQSELTPSTTAANYFYDGKTIEDYKDTPPINFQDLLFRSAKTNNHSISLRGGNDATRYSFTGSVYDQEGIIINSGYGRYQGRLSLDQTVSKKIRVGGAMNYSNIQTYGAPVALGSTGDGQLTLSNYLFVTAWSYRPLAGKDSAMLLDLDVDPLYADNRVNPVTSTKNSYNKTRTATVIANAYINYKILSYLSLDIKGSMISTNRRDENFYNSKTNRGRPTTLNVLGVNANLLNYESTILSSENTLTFNKTYNKIHNLNLLAGYSMQTTKGFRNGYTSSFIPVEELGISGMDGGTILYPVAASDRNALVSYFGRANYALMSKYLFTFVLRRDGSSKFPIATRWDYFPSGAIAWNLSREKFMDEVTFISNAKIRASYGITGNNRVTDFGYLPSLDISNTIPAYSFNNGTPTGGVFISSMGNGDLRWEKTAQQDLGFDFGFFKDRLKITLDFYNKKTSNLLMNVDMPSNAPVNKVYMNTGKIENKGWELEVNTTNVKKASFSWSTNFNISQNKNKLLSLTSNQNLLYTNIAFQSQFNMPAYISRVGEPIGQFWGLVHDGNYQYEDFDNPSENVYVLKEGIPTNGTARANIKPGDIKYKDLNGDTLVNSLDRTVLGSPTPKFFGGFTNDFTYKNFDLNIFFNFSYGNKIMNANRYILEGNQTQYELTNQFASYIDRWSPTNPTNGNFRTGGQGPIAYSSRVIEDGSFLRLKTLALGYSIPKQILNKWKMSQVRFSVSATNLATWTNYTGMDPEVSVRNTTLTQGFDFSPYPRGRTITLALNATF